jgi:predicted KAP-like P-loop ATPase
MWNDKETDIDLLGYDKIADTILEIVNDNNLRPLTIGVYGDWGVGKSSILSLLQSKVAQLPNDEQKLVHTIVFNGWLFQGYEDTKSALMETIVTDLARLQPNVEKVKKLAKSLLRRINWLKVAKVSASALFTGFTGIPHPGLIGSVVGFAKKGKELMEVDEAKNTVKVENEESFLKEPEDETVPSQIHAFRKEFKELIETSKIEQLIVLVDDLDRCLPAAVIEILEAIRLFLFVEGTVFVISADEKMIEYAVREHFPNLPIEYKDYTKNYLEKLIQIPIRIPTLNRMQTGNYIKFLMLQNHLQNDVGELKRIYQHYESKKTVAYENIDLTYNIIQQALGGQAPTLQETLSVGDQLYPLLSVGLKGNPRNIKRFLNTLFLRLKIAKIYGLDQVVQLDILAKLMLLERFHNTLYSKLVEEISSVADGKSAEIARYEGAASISPELDTDLFDWSHLVPALKDIDLRPYIFISKEKAVSFDQEQSLSNVLSSLLEKLQSGSMINLNKAESELNNVALKDANILFDRLLASVQSISNLRAQPDAVKGLYRIIKVFPQLEIRLMEFLASKPAGNLGVWVISESAGLTSQPAREKFNDLLDVWKGTTNSILKSMATQTQKF